MSTATHRITIQYHHPADPSTFHERYRTQHVPVASRLPGLQRYTVSRPRGSGSDIPELVAELWFEDEPTMKAALRSPEMAAAAADAATLDVGRMVVFTSAAEDLLS
jgi:uncharacterized protein (TIGR02118 family)